MQSRLKYILLFSASVALATLFVLALLVWLRPSFLTLHEERIIAQIIPARSEPGNRDQWVADAYDRFAPSVLPLVKKRKDSQYRRSAIVAAAVSVTSDGFIMTTVANLADYNAILPDGTVVEPHAIVRDEAAGVTYAKLSGPKFSALQISETKLLEPGEKLAVMAPTTLETSTFAGTVAPPIASIVQASSLSRRIRVASSFALPGSPVLRSDGAVGLLADPATHLVIPQTHFAPSLHRFLQSHRVIHPVLNVEVIDRDESAGAIGFSRGAEIVSVKYASPAQIAGLRPHDVILAVEGEMLQEDRPLAEILEQFDPGSKIDITIRRDGKELTVTVPLA